jgi:glycosyltransferase involved in cell wall biosynthesis
MKVAWLIHQGPELNWSSALRLRRLDISEHFHLHNWADVLVMRGYLDDPFEDTLQKLQDCQVVVFAEQSEYDLKLMQALNKRPYPPVLLRDHCENIWEFPWEMECFRAADLVVCSSHMLSRMATQRGLRNEVIEEHYDFCSGILPYRKLAGYMGTDGTLAAQIRDIAARHGWKLEILCRPEECVPNSIAWQEGTWRDHFKNYAVLIAPQRPQFPAKSPAKVLQALGNGMPVLASKVESYQRFVQHGVNGFLCDSEADWDLAFKMASDPHVLRYLTAGAQNSPVAKEYSLHNIALRWRQLFIRLLAEKWGTPANLENSV